MNVSNWWNSLSSDGKYLAMAMCSNKFSKNELKTAKKQSFEELSQLTRSKVETLFITKFAYRYEEKENMVVNKH